MVKCEGKRGALLRQKIGYKIIAVFLLCIHPWVFSESHSQIQLESFHHISPPHPQSIQLKSYLSAFMDWNKKIDYKPFSFQINGVADISLDKSNQVYVALPTAFVSYTYGFKKDWFLELKFLEVTLGRRIYSWSYADDYWELGFWNSLNNWKPLKPFSNGLIGTFFDLKAERWDLKLFIGGLYLPNQGAKLEEHYNKREGVTFLTSSSRWFSGIPRRLHAFGSRFDINYLIEMPFIFDFLFQESYIFSFKTWSGGEQNYWMKWNFSYKPVNIPFYVRNEHNSFRVFDDEDKKPHISQVLTFFPVKHRMISAEWGIDYKDMSALFSVGDNRVREVTDLSKGWSFIKERVSVTYLSGFLEYDFFFRSMKGKVKTGYIQSWFKVGEQTMFRGEEESLALLNDYKILEGFGVDMKLQWDDGRKSKWDFNFRYWYSLLDNGGLLSLYGDYYFSKNLFTGLGFHVLGAGKDNKSFLSSFRANDYFVGRIGYVF